jgi:hypothetical protein
MILSQFEHFSRNHWTAAFVGATMLVAHWFFLIAAGIELVLPSLTQPKPIVQSERTEEALASSGRSRQRDIGKIDASDYSFSDSKSNYSSHESNTME